MTQGTPYGSRSPLYHIEVRRTGAGARRGKGAGRGKEAPQEVVQVLVAETVEYTTYRVYSTSAKDGEELKEYVTEVYGPRCTCPAGQYDFQNCRALGCVHVQAARKRHAQRVYPAARWNEEILEATTRGLFLRLLAPPADEPLLEPVGNVSD